MAPSRNIPLYDPGAKPASWNERMAACEYAVHYSSYEPGTAAPFCSVFANLEDAGAFARKRVVDHPHLRFTIYDHNGFVGAPLRDIRGQAYKGDSDLSPRFRRWAGSILFLGGLALADIDWRADFRYSWPAMIGTRMLVPGMILLFTEAMIVLSARHRRLAERDKG